MIKFFRKIRQRLVSENKFSKYLIYAIGEIMLVVIGIMIAVQLNNRNQDRVQQKEIESILIKIQNEIVSDLHYSQNRFLRYVRRDSIKNRVMNRQITYEELKSGQTNLLAFSQDYFLFSMQTAGYEQLMEHLDDLPESYDHLVQELLNRQYRGGTLQRERVKMDIYNVITDYKNYLKEHQPWYGQDHYNKSISDAQIDFYLNDPFFLNHISRLNQALNTSINELVHWRYRAIRIFHDINELLGDNKQPVPDIARTTSLTSETEADKYVGTYVLANGPENTRFGKSVVVSANNKDLVIEYGEDPEPLLLRSIHTAKPWFTLRRSSMIFRFDHNGPNTISIIRGNRDQTSWVKVENE